METVKDLVFLLNKQENVLGVVSLIPLILIPFF